MVTEYSRNVILRRKQEKELKKAGNTATPEPPKTEAVPQTETKAETEEAKSESEKPQKTDAEKLKGKKGK